VFSFFDSLVVSSCTGKVKHPGGAVSRRGAWGKECPPAFWARTSTIFRFSRFFPILRSDSFVGTPSLHQQGAMMKRLAVTRVVVAAARRGAPAATRGMAVKVNGDKAQVARPAPPCVVLAGTSLPSLRPSFPPSLPRASA